MEVAKQTPVIKTPLKDEKEIVTVSIDNIRGLKGIWVKLVSLHETHLLSTPKDKRLIGKKIKILNRAFFIEEANGCVAVLLFGARVEISKYSLKPTV